MLKLTPAQTHEALRLITMQAEGWNTRGMARDFLKKIGATPDDIEWRPEHATTRDTVA